MIAGYGVERAWSCADSRGAIGFVVHGLMGQGGGGIAADAIAGLLRRRANQDSDWFSPYDGRFRALLADVVADLHEQLRRLGSHAHGGGVFDLVAICDGHARIAHIGDGRVYRVRAGRIEQLTEDHTVGDGVLARAIFPHLPGDLDIRVEALERGDLFIVASRALARRIESTALANVHCAEEACAALCALGTEGDELAIVVARAA